MITPMDAPGFWEGELWYDFHWAADQIGDKLSIPPGPAKAQLRKLCATGEVRTLLSEDQMSEPEHVSPSRWRSEDVDLTEAEHCLAVSDNDLAHWLDQQPTHPAGGKQSRVARLLVEMFPAGVPNRADCPREPLKAELVRRDPSLSPLDLKTLKTAIEAYNRQLGNARNASVSD
jgi:hypothetical protein